MQQEGDKPGPFQAGALLRLRGVAQCQVNGCPNPLPSTPLYYKKFRVCPAHASVKELDLAGWRVRFCQQCGRFQQLADFDGDRKSCRASLAKHNARRTRKASDAARKSQPAAARIAGVCATKVAAQAAGRSISGASSATPSSPSLSEGKPLRIASLPSPTAEPHAAAEATGAAAAGQAAEGGSPAKRRLQQGMQPAQQQQGRQPPPQQAQEPHGELLRGAGATGTALLQLQIRAPQGSAAQQGEPQQPIKREVASPPSAPGGLPPWGPAEATNANPGEALHSGHPLAGDWDALNGLASLVEQLVDSGGPQQPPAAAAPGPPAFPPAAPALGAAAQIQRPAPRRLAAATAGPAAGAWPGPGSMGGPAGLLDLLRLAESAAAALPAGPHHPAGHAPQLTMFQQPQQPHHHHNQQQQPYSPPWAAVQPAMFIMPPPGSSGQRDGAHPVTAFSPSGCPVGAWLNWLQYGGPAAQAVRISQGRPVPFHGPFEGGRGLKRAYPEGGL